MTADSTDELVRKLNARTEELEAKLEQKNGTIGLLEAQIAALWRGRADVIIDLNKNTFEEQTYSLQMSVSELQGEVAALRQTVTLCPRLQKPRLMCVNPYWKDRNTVADNYVCFLLMPFGKTWSKNVWDAIAAAAKECRLNCRRADEDSDRAVMEAVWGRIATARIVIADLSGANPNVTYEVGLADTVGKDVILISQTSDPTRMPFDFLGQRLIEYELSGLEKLSNQVAARIREMLR